MSSICIHCKEDAFDAEEQVCKACGIVNNDIQFGHDNNASSSFKPFQCQYAGKSKSVSLNYGIDMLGYLCRGYTVSPDVKREAKTLLKEVFSYHTKGGKSFRFREDAGILAGCCLLHVLKNHKEYVSIPSLCFKLQCTKKRVFRSTKILKSYLDQLSKTTECDGDLNEKPEIKAEGRVDDCVLDSIEPFITDLLSTAPQERKEELIEKTLSLTKLAYSCWLLTGRGKEGIVIAAAFLCWKSMHMTEKGMSLKRFCQEFSLNGFKSHARVVELRTMLLKLGVNIPSKTKNYVNEKNLLFHLGYILENSESLRNDLLSEEFTEDAMNQKEFDVFRGIFLKDSVPKEEQPCQYDSDMNASDVEISDTEISTYIRSDAHVNLIQNLKESKKHAKLKP